eukprot:Em0019g422a
MNKLLISLVIVVACLLNVVRSTPLPPVDVTNKVILYSRLSGRFVRVADNGAITATNRNQKSSSVFIMYLKNSQVQLELKNKPGMFLMLKELNHSIAENANITTSSQTTISHEYALVVDYPSESYLTEWENSGSCGALVQMMDENTNCFIAFDSSGKVAGPCNLSANNPASCISTLPASS